MANNSRDVKTKPAGINDDFQIVVMDINNVIEKGKITLKAMDGKKVQNLSVNLKEGMSIKAYNGGREKESER